METTGMMVWVLNGVFVLLGVYVVWSTIVRLLRYKKEVKHFEQGHSDIEVLRMDKGPSTGMFALGVLVLYLTFTGFSDGYDVAYLLIYVCVGVLFFALAIDYKMRYRVLFGMDSFFFEGQPIRFRMIKKITYQDGLFKKGMLQLSKGEEITCPYKIAKAIEEKQAAWKKQRKQK